MATSQNISRPRPVSMLSLHKSRSCHSESDLSLPQSSSPVASGVAVVMAEEKEMKRRSSAPTTNPPPMFYAMSNAPLQPQLLTPTPTTSTKADTTNSTSSIDNSDESNETGDKYAALADLDNAFNDPSTAPNTIIDWKASQSSEDKSEEATTLTKIEAKNREVASGAIPASSKPASKTATQNAMYGSPGMNYNVQTSAHVNGYYNSTQYVTPSATNPAYMANHPGNYGFCYQQTPENGLPYQQQYPENIGFHYQQMPESNGFSYQQNPENNGFLYQQNPAHYGNAGFPGQVPQGFPVQGGVSWGHNSGMVPHAHAAFSSKPFVSSSQLPGQTSMCLS